MPAYLVAQTPDARPRFDIIAVKQCVAPTQGGPGIRAGGFATSPGRLRITCMPAIAMLRSAYIIFAEPVIRRADTVPLEGAPAWTETDLYSVDATTSLHEATQHTLEGVMLQTLLEDRFKLIMRTETREVPVYDLVLASGGLKLKADQEGSCIPFDEPNGKPPGQIRRCGTVRLGRNGSNITMQATAMTLGEFTRGYVRLDRPIIDKTGTKALFSFRLEFAYDGTTAGIVPGGAAENAAFQERTGGLLPVDAPGGGPSIFSAFQELGLKLQPSRGPDRFLVVEGIQRPSEN